jgi:hypothetical protein
LWSGCCDAQCGALFASQCSGISLGYSETPCPDSSFAGKLYELIVCHVALNIKSELTLQVPPQHTILSVKHLLVVGSCGKRLVYDSPRQLPLSFLF